MRASERIVVLGASAGGVPCLSSIVGQLPADYPAAVFVVLHIPSYRASSLPEILNRAGSLPACHPEDGERIKPGRIYVAPPDHHLLVEGAHVAVKKGPKENRFRPSIDTLFRSAAYSHGNRVIGVVCSGALNDGTSGLWNIKRRGGIAVVQSPQEALAGSMPASALEQVEVDYTLPAHEIGELLARLVRERPKRAPKAAPELIKRMQIESAISAEDDAFQKGIMTLGTISPLTCPECHGVLVQISEGKMTRYRCHTGHAYSSSALLESVMESTGEMLWQIIRGLEEAVMLLKQMGQDAKKAGQGSRASAIYKKARELERRSLELQKRALTHESLSGENVGQQPKKPRR